MKNIEINDYRLCGENVEVFYFYENEPETMKTIELDALIEHVEYEGLHEGGTYFGVDHEGMPTEKEYKNADPTEWTLENLFDALESYLKFQLK